MTIDERCAMLFSADIETVTNLAEGSAEPAPAQATLTAALRAGWEAAEEAETTLQRKAASVPDDPFSGLAGGLL